MENTTSNKIIKDVKNGLKLDLTDTSKSNFKFTSPLLHEKDFFVETK